MSNTVIQEYFTLPSLGKIYNREFDPVVKLRSMTVAEEMKRLSVTDFPYRSMCDIISDCMETKIPVPVYDLCLGDYQYLLHKLRTVTYGPKYSISTRCPYCGKVFNLDIDLDKLVVFEYNDSYNEAKTLVLPKSGDTIELEFQTPRTLDNIEAEKRKLEKEFPEMTSDPTLMLNLESVIKYVNGKILNPIELRDYVKALNMMDSNIILDGASKLNSKVGIDTVVTDECPHCNHDVASTFRYTTEFFRPRV